MIKNHMAVLIIAACLSSIQARAEDNSLGFIKRVSGRADVIANGNAIAAEPGMPVYLNNSLKTGKDGSVGLTFKDNTVISLGPDTEVVIDEYLYAPAKDQLKLTANLLQGTLHYISGVIAKLRPEAVSVITPSGVIGVRGTRFLAKAEAK